MKIISVPTSENVVKKLSAKCLEQRSTANIDAIQSTKWTQEGLLDGPYGYEISDSEAFQTVSESELGSYYTN
jgi:hypothetical protein